MTSNLTRIQVKKAGAFFPFPRYYLFKCYKICTILFGYLIQNWLQFLWRVLNILQKTCFFFNDKPTTEDIFTLSFKRLLISRSCSTVFIGKSAVRVFSGSALSLSCILTSPIFSTKNFIVSSDSLSRKLAIRSCFNTSFWNPKKKSQPSILFNNKASRKTANVHSLEYWYLIIGKGHFLWQAFPANRGP